jgi:hypothetical protein
MLTLLLLAATANDGKADWGAYKSAAPKPVVAYRNTSPAAPAPAAETALKWAGAEDGNLSQRREDPPVPTHPIANPPAAPALPAAGPCNPCGPPPCTYTVTCYRAVCKPVTVQRQVTRYVPVTTTEACTEYQTSYEPYTQTYTCAPACAPCSSSWSSSCYEESYGCERRGRRGRRCR